MYFQVLNYKMYLPYHKKDMIQKHISTTNQPYEFDILKNIFSILNLNRDKTNTPPLYSRDCY